MKKYLYYPGCSLKGTGRAYEESLLAVFKALGVEIKAKVVKALASAGLDYKGTVKVRHPLDVLVNDIGLDVIKAKINSPLKGRKFAPYYGCQVVRPFATFDDQHEPVTMDKLIMAAGGTCVDYPLKTRCCGGSLTGTLSEVGLRLAYIIIKEAKKRGADAVVTPCPLCQFNLDGYQDQIARQFEAVDIPVLYFTQVLGLGMGLSPDSLGIKRGIISAEAVLAGR